MRLALAPTLIAAGSRASVDGTPIAQRLDLEFPEHPEAKSDLQYLLGDDLLVAPVDPWVIMDVHATAYREFNQNGCFTIKNRSACCQYLDGRQNSDFHGVPCMPSREGTSFSSGNVCEPSCWVEGDCGKKPALQRRLAGTCFNRHTTVWIPPGQWEDAWSGEVLSGPRSISVQSPPESIPLYHRRPGLLLTADSWARNVQSQDRGHLIVEAFPGEIQDAPIERRWQLDNLDDVQLRATVDTSDGSISIHLDCTQAGCKERSWLVRVHLRANQEVTGTLVDQVAVSMGSDAVRLLPPASRSEGVAPALAGSSGVAPPPLAGAILEVKLPAGRVERKVQVRTTSPGPITI